MKGIMHIGSLRWLAIVWMLAWGLLAMGQQPYLWTDLQDELAKRGIDESQFVQKLRQRGLDPEQLARLSPQELQRYRPQLEEILEELQQPMSPGEEYSAPPQRRAQLKDTVPPKRAEVDLGQTDADTLRRMQREDAVFGRAYFARAIQPISVREGGNVPGYYVLGPGDVLHIGVWGVSQHDGQYEIRTDGYIDVPRVGRVYLQGKTLEEARQILLRAFEKFFKVDAAHFEVQVVQPRMLTVHIYGEVPAPGAYRLSAVNTALNALAAAGGIDSLGSVRNIRLHRAGEEIDIDLYRWIRNPAYANELYLQDHDVIYVPASEYIVDIRGAVVRPMRYELRSGEGLADLLEYAGGFSPRAYRDWIVLVRYQGGKRMQSDIPWQELRREGKNFPLLPGDSLFVYSMSDSIENALLVEGAVQYPGQYAWHPQMRISDVLFRAQLQPSASKQRAYIMRQGSDGRIEILHFIPEEVLQRPQSPDDLPLHRNDRIFIPDQRHSVVRRYVEVRGAVRKPKRIPYDIQRNFYLSDALLIADGLQDRAFPEGFILRRDSVQLHSRHIRRVNFHKALRHPHTEMDPLLKPGDIVEVLHDSSFRYEIFVYVFGEVKNPDTFRYYEGMGLKDLILMAGGLLPSTDSTRIELFRTTWRDGRSIMQRYTLSVDTALRVDGGDFALQPGDKVVFRRNPAYRPIEMVEIRGEVRFPGAYAIARQNYRLLDLIKDAGGLTQDAFIEGASLFRRYHNVGKVALHLSKAMHQPESAYNVYLREGDEIYIPRRNNLVTVQGATNYTSVLTPEDSLVEQKISFPYIPGKSAIYYVNEFAGGISETGDLDKITVIYPNGRVAKTKNYWLFRKYPPVMPGSTIYVGSRPPTPEGTQKEKVDWDKIVDNTLKQITSILSLVILAQTVGKL